MYAFTNSDVLLLNQLGIDIIDENRSYWFVRTQGGLYFDDFYFEGYIGIEWDEIVPTDSTVTFEDIKSSVEEQYPEEKRSGYIAGQICRFVNEFKKGDIVIIPNKDSKRFAFGEIIDDDIFIHEITDDERFQLLINEEPEKIILKKRRSVKWLKTIARNELDPYLQTFIYAHNTIVDLKPYALFVDRTLSDFYIKGDEAFYTQRVQKDANIPFDDLVDLFNLNKGIINFINENVDGITIERGEIISKVAVQSKGPVQFKGPMMKVLAVGVCCMTLCGGHIKINVQDGIEIGSEGIVTIINSVVNAYDIIKTHQENDEIEKLEKAYNDCKEKLELYENIIDTEIDINEP